MVGFLSRAVDRIAPTNVLAFWEPTSLCNQGSMISVQQAENLSLERMAAFLQASEPISFIGENRQQV